MSCFGDMQEFFGPESSWPAFRAVAEDHMLDFRAIMIPEKDDEWIVTTTNGRWAFRRLPQEQRDAFVQQLRKDGLSVG
ncbi:hypothetical protein ACIPV2_13115 [Microbacterium sp. NPDC089987]|uniref:hypothetical protein n=1 Tax=Microbacterium sp. NPDC089987 TaxID=3364202 RepID=UPI00381F02F5